MRWIILNETIFPNPLKVSFYDASSLRYIVRLQSSFLGWFLVCLFFPVQQNWHYLRSVLKEVGVPIWQHCSALVSAGFDSAVSTVQFERRPCAFGLLSSTPAPFTEYKKMCSWAPVPSWVLGLVLTKKKKKRKKRVPVSWWGFLNSWSPEEEWKNKTNTAGQCSKVVKHNDTHRSRTKSCMQFCICVVVVVGLCWSNRHSYYHHCHHQQQQQQEQHLERHKHGGNTWHK